VALSSEVPPGGAPLPVRLLGEDLALFRDESERCGLLGIHCSHRAADLSYGRIEDGGLRCLYHGWLYDVVGNCLEQPGEPEGSVFKEKVKHLAYLCQEKGGIVFAYLGAGEPPFLPDYTPLMVDTEHQLVVKFRLACNYLQGYEGNIDPTHLSFLHRMLNSDQGRDVGRSVANSERTRSDFEREYVCPTIDLEDTDYGTRIFTTRPAFPGKQYVSTTNFVFPNLAKVAGSPAGFRIVWHVPIDDHQHTRWDILCQLDKPFAQSDRDFYRDEFLPDGRLVRNPDNRYKQDPVSRTMGPDFLVHDAFATESQGVVQDRTVERLGYTDKVIASTRRKMLQAIRDVQEGADPPHVVRDAGAANMAHIVASVEVVDDGTARNAWRGRTSRVRELPGTAVR
jgi:phenylpropionate dioxygenase-like ring-hydroxylating dioxygenase large terminal subunit